MSESIDAKEARVAERNRCHDLIQLAKPLSSAADQARWRTVADSVYTDATPEQVRAQLDAAGLLHMEDPPAPVTPDSAPARSASSGWRKIAERMAARQQSEPTK